MQTRERTGQVFRSHAQFYDSDRYEMAAPKITEQLLAGYIAEGRGFGHGELYKAMLQLRRWNASPVSVQTHGAVPPHSRPMHFMCRSEWLLALLFAWVGCFVREQMPMWPWRHLSPRHGLCAELDHELPWSEGTLAICKGLGIGHGTYVGTTIEYIWTLDLVLTLGWLPVAKQSCVVVSVKPLSSEEYSGDIDPLARGPEKLEVERTFAKQLSLLYFVADRTLFPGHLLGQLEFYANAATVPSRALSDTLARFLDRHGPDLCQIPPIEWRDRLACEQGIGLENADRLVQHLIWTQLVDVDLTREIDWEAVVRPGGRALIAAIRRELTKAPN